MTGKGQIPAVEPPRGTGSEGKSPAGFIFFYRSRGKDAKKRKRNPAGERVRPDEFGIGGFDQSAGGRKSKGIQLRRVTERSVPGKKFFKEKGRACENRRD